MGKHRDITIGVGVLVPCPTGKEGFLVTRRKKGSSWGAGSLCMPGGHIEEFETAHACAVRECEEETGLVVRPRMLDGHTYILHAEEWFRQNKHHWTMYVVADAVGGVLANPEPHKHEPWTWASFDHLKSACKPDDWIPLRALAANRKKIWP